MKPSTAFLLLTTSLVSAQSGTAVPESGCGNAVDLIIQACLKLEQPLSKLCAANDWNCLCDAATNVRTCYNNCPSDPRAVGATGTQLSYCAAAKTYPSSTTSLAGRAWPAATASATMPSTHVPSGGTSTAWPMNGTMPNATLPAVEAVMGSAERFVPSDGILVVVVALLALAL